MNESERLGQFSELIRESSLKRFKKVAPGDRVWRPNPTQLSFADILKHLVDADNWVMAILTDAKNFPRADIHPGQGRAADWEKLLSELETLGKKKAELIRKMSERQLSQEVQDWEVMGTTTKWLVLMRGNLDHEIHHRGSLQILLNLKYRKA